MLETTFWILTALTVGRRHGYAVMRDVDELSDGTVALRVTTLYASLDRLAREGRVSVAGEEVVEGRARRYYEITEEGLRDLELESQRLAARVAASQARMAARRRAAPHPATLSVAPS